MQIYFPIIDIQDNILISTLQFIAGEWQGKAADKPASVRRKLR